MDKIRRIVTGHSKDGKSVVVSDSNVGSISLSEGKNFMPIWGKDSTPSHPNDESMDAGMEWFPTKGGHRFFIWTIPPLSQQSAKRKPDSEIEEILPGFLKYFEPKNPGMHTSDCVDCTYLISGTVFLELDDEVEIAMNAGDSVVQNGTRHRWHNRTEIPAVFVTTSIGSERD